MVEPISGNALFVNAVAANLLIVAAGS
jgi:hypothetical protein